MKRIMNYLILTVFSYSLFGQDVTFKEALQVAEKVAKIEFSKAEVDLKGIKALTGENVLDTMLYIMPVEQNGFILISANKNLLPVLGICKKGEFTDIKTLPLGLQFLIEKYISETKLVRKHNNFYNSHNIEAWNSLEFIDQTYKTSSSGVSPMIQTEWAQRSGFNQFVPNNSPAGCTAVAMAQILRYWACRVKPTGELNHDGNYANFGSTTYNWASMGNFGADANNALLIYHAGISCKTNYRENGSTSLPGKARDGFVNHWGMKSSADVRWRMWHLQTWGGQLKNQLDKGFPLLYSGGSAQAGGHSWVIDGYMNNLFHCNWGWSSGNYNGYYSLGGFNPGGDSLNEFESAIFWVEPELEHGIGIPQSTSKSFTYSGDGYIISIPEAWGATAYEWTTEYGSIVGNSNSVKLYTDRATQVSVRAFNSLCNIYSPIVTTPITINYGPISGPSPLCKDAIGTYTINNFPPGATVQWSTSGALQIVQTNDSSVVVKSMDESAGNSFLYAQITVGGTQFNLTKIIDTKTSYRVTGNSYVNCGSAGRWSASFSNCMPIGNISYEGTITNQNTGEQVIFYTPTISLFSSCTKSTLLSSTINSNDNVIMQPPGLPQAYYDITITATTESGNTYSDVINNISVYGYVTIFTLDLDKIGYSFILSPNPVSDSFVSVSLKDSEMQINKSSTHTIQLWSSLGLVKTVQTDEPEYQLDLSGVAPGFYYVHVIKDGQTYKQQLVIR